MKQGGRASYLTVAVPVADLRREPIDAPFVNVHDDLQETQLLFDELLLLKDEKGDWLHVEATEQRKSNGEGLSGWVWKKCVEKTGTPRECTGIVRSAFTVVTAVPSPGASALLPLSLGTRVLLTGASAKGFVEIALPRGERGWVPGKDVAKRGGAAGRRPATGREIARTARLFLGVPYLWGGRSMPMAGIGVPRTGVDCSGLVDLAFRAHDMEVPRDAHEQWLSASPIDADRMRPGDLIFLSGEGEASPINHVMLSLGGERFLEAPDTGDVVRARTFTEKFGLDLGGLGRQDFSVRGRRLYFGRMGIE